MSIRSTETDFRFEAARSKVERGAMLAAALTAITLICASAVPLGVPGEWEWRRVAPAALWLTFLSLAIAAACYVAFVWLGARWIDCSSRLARAAWLWGLVLGGFGWLWMAQEAAPEGYQLSKAAWVLYFPGPSGYFTEARADERPLREFLGDYERRMSEGDVLHIGTHPPGLIVVFRGLLAACRAAPWLTNFVVASEPDSVRLSLDSLAETAAAAHSFPVTRIDRAVLWLAALLAQGISALTVLPLFGLLRRGTSPRASWWGAAFWPTVPAVAVFLPKSDAVFPCFTALILWLWLSGVDRNTRLRCVLAGLSLCLALVLSLAFLPIAFLAALATIWPHGFQQPESPANRAARRSLVAAVAWGVAGFALPCVLLRVYSGTNLLFVWWLNLRNHAGFYHQFSRTYWKWCLINPIEFAIAAGAPLVCLAAFSVSRQFRDQGLKACGAAGAFLATWGILWLSGKNMGEAARLWILLTPCLIWIAGPFFGQAAAAIPGSAQAIALDNERCAWALCLQLAVSAAIVVRVVGFHYA
jgi:hypothetical protein